MQITTTPIAARSVAITHNPTRRPHAVSRHFAPQPQFRPGQSITRRQDVQSPRSRVLEAFHEMAHGIATPAAQAHTELFYRSSGQEWAHSLIQQGGNARKARIVDAFRDLAHGVQDTAAHAKTLKFYLSGGQNWAKSLG
jgi:hypothetical protein